MDKTLVDTAFCRHREIAARVDYLIPTISRLMDRLDGEREALIGRSPVSRLDGMPHSGRVGSSVEEDCIRAADGEYPADVQKLDELIDRLNLELDEKQHELWIVDIGIRSMSEKERFVVEAKCFDGLTYAEIGIRYAVRYGHELTRDAVRNVYRSAMDKVYEVVDIGG